MKNRKTTKYTLTTSIISIFLCAVMLIGTTFAWFTDEANTAVNTIQSGTLDVALEDEDGNNLEGDTLDWVNVNGGTDILWEPNCTYDLETVKIVNKGNLALKYKVIINGVDGDAKLLEAIDFTVKLNGEEIALADFEGELLPAGEEGSEATLEISGHMYADAGNEYQDLSIEGLAITVKAAQLPYEYDSIDNQYDANAPYAEAEEIFVPETFFGKLTNVHNLVPYHIISSNTYTGKDAVLVSEKEGTTVITVDNIQVYNVKATVYLAAGSTTEEIVFDDGDLYIKGDYADNKLVMNYSGSDVKVTFKNGVKLNGVEITSADQVAPYLVNVTDIVVL